MKVSLEDMIKEEGSKTDNKDGKKNTSSDGSLMGKIWNAKSPDKKVSEYGNHALNFDGKESTGKIIRGTEGLVGSLDRAIVEVVVGTIQKIVEVVQGLGKEQPP